MDNRLVTLARFDFWLHRLTLLRWLVRAILLIILLLALLNRSTLVGSSLFGIFFILLPLGIALDLFRMFLRSEVGLAEKRQGNTGMSYATARLLVRSNTSAKLWYTLLHDDATQFLLLRFALSPRQLYESGVPLPEYQSWLRAAEQAARLEQQPMAQEHLFEIIQSSEPLAGMWREMGVSEQDRREVWQWYRRFEWEEKKAQRGFADTLRFSGGIGRDWASGYTHALEQYADNVTKYLQQQRINISLVGHTEERKKILEYLSRNDRHNLALVGDEGIGKQRIVYSLASDFVLGQVPLNLKYKHIYILDVGKVMSSASQNELEMRLHDLLDEASTVGNVIVVIPDFHLLVGGQGGNTLGTIDASAVFSSYLQSPSIQIIAIMTPDAYYRFIKPNAGLEPYLLPIEVKEIHADDALRILEDEVNRYELQTNRLFTYHALTKIIEIAERYVHDRPYPEKVLALLEDVASGLTDNPQRFVFSSDVERILGEKLKVPIGQVTGSEREVLTNLEQLIQARIVGQKEAVQVVANALRRVRAGLHSGKRPVGSFLFLGPTGVGKTEMAKTIAAIYYKNEKAFIRLDMSEYQTPESISKLIGSRDTPGYLTTAITDQPFSVVLLDEIEKASQDVRNLFLQILDEGHITDGYGKRVDFTNAMVIATSNAGAPFIREAVQASTIDATFRQRLLDWLQTQGIFSPEWLNRFDAIVTFLPLTKEEIRQVAELQVKDLIERLKSHNINLTLSDDVYDILIERGYDPQFGARPMRRAVQDIIESALAKALLSDTNEGAKNITLTKAMLV